MKKTKVNIVVTGFFCFVVGMLISGSAISSEYFDLGQLTNVNTTGVTNGQVIKFNDSDSFWYPANTSGTGGFTYSDYFNQQLNTTDDVLFNQVTFRRFLLSGYGGIIDAGGDPWYMSGTSLRLAENLTVNHNVTAEYFIGNGSQLTGISSGSGIWTNNSGTAYYYNDVEVENDLTVSGDVGIGTSTPSAKLDVEVASNGAACIGDVNCVASGFCSVAMGIGTDASGDGAIAGGRDTTAFGRYSAAFGCGSTVGDYGFTAGNSNTITGRYSSALGSNLRIPTGRYSFAIGANNDVGGSYSFTGGRNMNPSSGDGTFIWGHSAATQAIAPANNRFLIFPQGDNGRVGINTTNPNAELDVSGDVEITNNLAVGNNVEITNNLAVNSDNLFVDASDGQVGIGISSPYAHLHVYDNTVSTASNFYGIRNDHTKTAGGTTEGDDMYGIFNRIYYNDAGSTAGHLRGIYTSTHLNAGTIGDGQESVYGIFTEAEVNGGTANTDVVGTYSLTDINAGTIGDDVMGVYTMVDIESGVTSVGDDVYGNYIWIDVDKNPIGSVYALYIQEYSGIDYGIYQNGNADNYFGGDVGIGTNAPNYELEVSGAIMMEDMATPSSSAGHAGIYADHGELYALDAAGHSTLLSPHDNLGDWIFRSLNTATGNEVIINMMDTIKIIENISGNKLIYDNIETYENRETNLNDIIHLTPLATAPDLPSEGDIYYNSVNHKAYCYDGTNWQGMW